jgi:hypothetical protein
MNLLKALVLSAIAVPAICFAADAPKESCADIKWNAEFLKEYPKAPAACREVTVRDGVKYAKFDGHVIKAGPKVVEVEIHNVANTAISKVGFHVGKGGTITLNDKEAKVEDLKIGDLITFWVREGKYGVSPTLTEKPLRMVKPTAMPAN